MICIVSFNIASAQGFLKVDGKRIVDEKGNNVLLRGMGLGGWMLQEGYMLRVNGIGQQQHVIKKNISDLIGTKKADAFYDAWLANHTRKIDIDSMARWGFNSIRLAMHYKLYTLPVEQEPVAGQNTWLDKGFAMTDSLLNWCKANKIYLILDLHGAPGGQGNDLNIADRDPSVPSLWQSDANKQKMIALWRKLAERYVNEPWIAAYDIINEPNWGSKKRMIRMVVAKKRMRRSAS
ncbi:MAG: cellulase family glycosylhydrolase [Bacteroidota bacterium]